MEIERFIFEMLIALGAGTAAGLLFLGVMSVLSASLRLEDDESER